jgi:hypothetical protein
MKQVIPASPNTIIKWYGDKQHPQQPDMTSTVIAWLYDDSKDNPLADEIGYTFSPLTSDDVTYWLAGVQHFGMQAQLFIDCKKQ